MKTKDKLYDLRQTIDDLIAIGPDYAHFMNAQIAQKKALNSGTICGFYYFIPYKY